MVSNLEPRSYLSTEISTREEDYTTKEFRTPTEAMQALQRSKTKIAEMMQEAR